MFDLIVPDSDYTIVYDGEDVTIQFNGVEIFRGRGPLAEDYADLLVNGCE